MPTVKKVTHEIHAYQKCSANHRMVLYRKIDGQRLKPQKMDATDLAAYQEQRK